MSGRLIGKVALVSGGARGMGASHVRAMVAEGAKVVFGDILDEEGKAVAAELADAARYVHLDVTQPAQWTAAVDTAVTAFGGLHVLVNNAGILNIGTIEDYALTEWQRILDVNLTGVFLGIRAVVKPMKEAGRGSIINISSIEGLANPAAHRPLGASEHVSLRHCVAPRTRAAAPYPRHRQDGPRPTHRAHHDSARRRIGSRHTHGPLY